jgi:hypothetical protein
MNNEISVDFIVWQEYGADGWAERYEKELVLLS